MKSDRQSTSNLTLKIPLIAAILSVRDNGLGKSN